MSTGVTSICIVLSMLSMMGGEFVFFLLKNKLCINSSLSINNNKINTEYVYNTHTMDLVLSPIPL